MVAQRRSSLFDNVDPRLAGLIEGFQYGPYKVNPTSGYRPGDPRRHGQGNAMDVQLIDPKTGAALANYQDPSTFGAYQEYANALYQHALQTNPELAQQIRWGGYFGGPKGKYGAMDLMHFDIGGGPMAGGSWEGGLNPEQAKLWGLQAGGGVGGAGSQQGPPAPPQDPHQAFIYNMWPLAVAQSQRTGVDPRIILAQTIQETGWGKSAPNNNYFGVKGAGKSQKTLEFINGRMQPVEDSFRGYKDPSESFADYGSVLMGDRYKGLREAKGLEAQAAALQASGYATDPNYGASILAIAQGIPEGGYPSTSPGASSGATTTNPGDPLKPPTAPAPRDNKSNDLMASLGGIAGISGKAPALPASTVPKIPASMTQAQMQPVANTTAPDQMRSQLAQRLALLNSGKLWG